MGSRQYSGWQSLLDSAWSRLLVVAMALAALGAAPAPSGPSGKLLGAIAGAVLFAVVAYQMYLLSRPAIEDRESGAILVVTILLVLWGLKTAALMMFPGFGVDVGSYQAWALQIAQQGPAHTYQQGYFLDYPPGYLYALWISGAMVGILGATGDAMRIIVESPALVADVFLAFAVFAWIRKSNRREIAIWAVLMVALNPALLFDTVVWGQSDSVLTLVMWLAVAAMLASEYEIAWALGAIAVLVKPQGLMLLPVLGVWTLLEADFATWVRSGLVLLGAFFLGIAPFQIGHEWNWIIKLYTSTAAYYHETSCNAFNFMALLGGLRQDDAGALLGISYFTIGMSLLVPLYGFVAYVLMRRRDARAMFYASFVALFGFFMFAPRMHERYLYPAVVFAIPLALEDAEMLVVFAILTLTCLFNLAYIKHTLETVVFLDAHDGLAMVASAFNLAAFALTVRYGLSLVADEEKRPAAGGLERFLGRISPQLSAVPRYQSEPIMPLKWIRADTIIIGALVAVSIATRFWHLGHPPEIVFDEVHFVGQARHYLHGESFLDPHPPLAKLIIAAGIFLFGDHPWSWRLGNATLGTILVAVTYLLGRRLFHSRLAAAFAAAFVLCDGLFLVDSRYACIDIVYITFAAISYLLLFRMTQSDGVLAKRRVLPWIGVALGLCLGSKLYIPAFTCLFVASFIAYDFWMLGVGPVAGGVGAVAMPDDPYREQRMVAAVVTVGAVTAILYIVTFLPHYILGWWGGITDLFSYYHQVVWYENSVASATHPYASPWWSWVLMLRPVAYWQNFPKTGKVATVWGGANPVLLWGALTAMTITMVRAIERPSRVRIFLVTGYLGYLLMWVWIGRTLFLYHYMPSLYIAYLALGGIIAECWTGAAELWEHIALLLTLMPVLLLGLGPGVGAIVALALGVGYFVLLQWPEYAGRYVCVLFVGCGAILFVYFFPLWTAIPIERAGYYARMWLQGPGLRNWI